METMERELKDEMEKMRAKNAKGEKEEEQEVEGLKVEEWPALPGVKTPTSLHW